MTARFHQNSAIRETSTTGGTGNQVLAGAFDASYRTFSTKYSDGDTCRVEFRQGTSREVSRCTFNSGANSLTRNTVIFSTNSNNLVNFSAGQTVDIFVTNVAEDDMSQADLLLERAALGAALKGHIFGLTLSNNGSDATNDIDIAVGEAASEETSPQLMILSSALTKQLDAGWAAGTNQGMRYSGAAITNTTYHLYLVTKANGLDADIYADPSATIATVLGHLQAETGGSAYTSARRIGSIIRSSGSIRAFAQKGDEFTLNTAVANEFSGTWPSASLTALTLTGVPAGIAVKAKVAFGFRSNLVIGAVGIWSAGRSGLGSNQLDNADAVASGNTVDTTASSVMSIGYAWTDTSRQIQYSGDGGGIIGGFISTQGWVDPRGRLS